MFTNRFFRFLVIGVLVMILALTIQDAIATRAIAIDTESRETQRERSLQADTARWTAMGEYYQNLAVEEAALQRGRAADIARWSALAERYQRVAEAQKLQRGRTADAARWTAMAEYYEQVSGATRK